MVSLSIPLLPQVLTTADVPSAAAQVHPAFKQTLLDTAWIGVDLNRAYAQTVPAFKGWPTALVQCAIDPVAATGLDNGRHF